MEDSSSLMSIEECAAFAGVSLDTVIQYAEFGLLPAVERDGKSFFKEGDVTTIFHLSSKERVSTKGKEREDSSDNSSQRSDDAKDELHTSSSVDETDFSEQSNVIPLNEEIEVTASGASSRGESLRIVELLQLCQSLREQIDMIKEDRDWLRTRLERLEARSEREQMLLLSESETVRSLISQKGSKKNSFWRIALPWSNTSND